MYWYVRNNNKVKGPFPEKQIQQLILLGRISLNAEISQDKEEWRVLRRCPELIPDELKIDPNDVAARERLAAARRWADERRYERREETERQVAGRRKPESAVAESYRQSREAYHNELIKPKRISHISMFVVALLLTLGLYAGFTFIPDDPASVDCRAAPKPGVNWSHCQLSAAQHLKVNLDVANLNSTNLQGANLFGSTFVQADLSYADLSNSNMSLADLSMSRLIGANLRGADLTKANLSYADLSYANLQGANIKQINLKRTILDDAIWIDGRVCAVGSIGHCQP